MRTKKLLLAGAMPILLSMPAEARNVYVYLTNNYTPVSIVRNIRKITFSEEGIGLQPKTGKGPTIEYAAFDYFRFQKTPVPVSVGAVTDDDAPIVLNDGNTVRISGKAGITFLTVWSAQGMQIVQESPKTTTYTLSTESWKPGVYLVKVVSEGKETVVKIIK